jgi:PIN domain nuclease of toxin-antitoxin system
LRLLLDTHALIWWLGDNPLLGAQARKLIRDPANEVFVSAATAWEIATKQSLGKLEAPDDLEAVLAENDFSMLLISFAHATAAGRLAPFHNDPFDRMLVAQAQMEHLTLMSNDRRMALYEVALVPA